MTRGHGIEKNCLLRQIAKDDLTALLPHLERVTLPLGRLLGEADKPMSHAYFPLDGIVSLLCEMDDGDSAEIAVVGHEGVVGVALFMGGDTTPSRAIVQSAGEAYRLKASLIQDAFHRSGSFQQQLLRYTQALLAQMALTAVCNRHHTVERQLCRWLLLSLDRLPGNELIMTQELIANMLGVRRERVSVAAHALQEAGLISYRRGHITVLDRPGLEAHVCQCYAIVKREYDRLVGSSATR